MTTDDPMAWMSVSTDVPTCGLTAADLEQAMAKAMEQDVERRDAERRRVLAVQSWLETLPAHARRHIFVRTMAHALERGAIVHPRTAREGEEYIERITAMTPADSDLDSDRLLARLAAVEPDDA